MNAILELSYSLFEDRALILEQTYTLLEDPRYIRTSQVLLEQPATLLENPPLPPPSTTKNGCSILIIERRFKIRK